MEFPSGSGREHQIAETGQVAGDSVTALEFKIMVEYEYNPGSSFS
jgi:hypothetical protein